MPTLLRTATRSNIGTTPIDVIETSGANRFTLIGCNLANRVDTQVIVDLIIVNSLAEEIFYIRQLSIDPYTSIKVITNGEKLILSENHKLRIVSDTLNSVDATISYAETN